MTDNENADIIELPLTPQDEADLARLESLPEGGVAPEYHTVLHIFREVLKNSDTERLVKITPQWASRITQSYQGITFRDMPDFREIYFDKIEELKEILAEEIKADPDCLGYVSAEEDRLENREHYINLLREWQLKVLSWELDWDCEDTNAYLELAAISEVHKMFFGENGVTGWLDAIGFEFTDEDRATLSAALEELREGQ